MQLSRIEESSDGEVGTGEGKLTGWIIWLCVGSGPGSPLRQEVEGSMGEGEEWSVGMSIWIGDVWNSIHMRE